MAAPLPSAELAREYLVQRLVADQRLAAEQLRARSGKSSSSTGSHSDGEASDSSSDPGAADISERAAVPQMAQPGGAGNPLFQNPFYAATLGALAQQMNLFQPSANTLSMLYPNLYQSLLTFPNLDQLRFALQSPGSGPGSPGALPAPKTPESTKATYSPSPRKRHSQQKQQNNKPSSDPQSPSKKPRAIKRLQFDNETCSPVSGMFIKEAEDLPPPDQLQAEADILDDSAKFVEVTEEAKAEIAKIPNLIGDYICRLCKVKYDDVFKLAQHKCPRIVHEEYRCPECAKVFSCPANLASHRRWHKPKEAKTTTPPSTTPTTDSPLNLSINTHHQSALQICVECGKTFASKQDLNLHALSHTAVQDNNPAEMQCPDTACGVWCVGVNSLEKHRTTAHPLFQCRFCPETFPTSPALTRHINKFHPTDNCKVVMLDR